MKKRPVALSFAAWAFLAFLVYWGRYAPRRVGYAGMEIFCKSVYYFLKSRRRVGIENLRVLYPDASGEKLENILYRTYVMFARFMAEFGKIADLTPENLGRFVTFHNFDLLKEAHGRGKGVILATAHFDNFEMMNAAIAVKGLPVYSVIREVDFPAADSLLDGVRNAAGVKVIKRERAATDIIKRLRKGNIVTIAADQNASFNYIHVKFMGKWASTFKSPAVIHLRTGAPIITAYSVREKDDTHTVFFLPEIRITPSGNLKNDIFNITQAIADAQAKFIAERPELWFWIHRRWKNQPTEKELETLLGFVSESELQPGAKEGAKGVTDA